MFNFYILNFLFIIIIIIINHYHIIINLILHLNTFCIIYCALSFSVFLITIIITMINYL